MSLDIAEALKARGNVAPYGQPLLGSVVSWDATQVTVTIDGEQVTVPRLRAYTTPQVDDVALVLRAGNALYCLGALNAAPSGPPSNPPPPPPPSTIYTKTWKPVYTGTFHVGEPTGSGASGWEGGDTIRQGGVVDYGAAYYGAFGPGTLSGKVAVSGSVKMRAFPGQGGQPTMRLLTHKTRPGATVYPTSILTDQLGPVVGAAAAATWALPLAWVQELLNGNAGGIGIGVPTFGSPGIALQGRTQWAYSMDLTLKWKD